MMTDQLLVPRELLERFIKASVQGLPGDWIADRNELRALLAQPAASEPKLYTDHTLIRGWLVGCKYFGVRIDAVRFIQTGQAEAEGNGTELHPLYFANPAPASELKPVDFDYDGAISELQAVIDTGALSVPEHEELEADICERITAYWIRPKQAAKDK